MWWSVLADGNEFDIIHAYTADEACELARVKHGDAVWTAHLYGVNP